MLRSGIGFRTPLSAVHLAALALVTAAASAWLTLDRLKYAVVRYLENEGDPSGLVRFVFGELGALDVALLAALAALIAALALLEVRGRALSAALADGRRLMPFLLALLLWFGHAYLYSGQLLAGDAGSHIARTAHLRMGLERGRLIDWDNYFYMGETALQFTGPLYFWLTAAIDYVIRDPDLTTKLALFALHVAGGLVCWRLALVLGLAPFGAMVSAVAYAGAFAHLHLMIWEGAFPQAVTLVLLPLALLLIERLLAERGHATLTWSLLTLVNAGLLVNHQATGVYLAVFVALYTAVRLASRGAWKRVGPLASSAAASVLMGAFAVVPVLTEKSAVMMYDHAEQFLRLTLPDADFFTGLLAWSNGDSRGVGAAYVGISVWMLAAWGFAGAVRAAGRSPVRSLGLILAACLLGAFMLRGSHARHMVAVIFFAALLAGLGAHLIAVRSGNIGRLPFAVLVLLLLDLGLTAVQPLARTDKAYFSEAGAYLAEQRAHERILLTRTYDGALSASIGPGGPPLLYFPVQFLVGAHNLAATHSHNYIAAAIKLVERDLRAQAALGQDTEAVLEMFNVGRIVNDSGRGLGLPDSIAGGVAEAPLGRVLEVRAPSPVIFSTRLLELSPPGELDKPVLWNESFEKPSERVARLMELVHSIPGRMDYDPTTRSAGAIPVRTSLQGNRAGEAPPASWDGRIERYDVQLDRVQLSITSRLAGFAQLAHPWYPRLEVTWNGQALVPIRGTMNFLVVPVEAGRNDYEIEHRVSPERRGYRLLSAAVFLLVLGLAAWRASRPIVSRKRQR